MPGNVRDGRERDRPPSGDGTAFHADAACGSRGTRDEPARPGIADQVRCEGLRGHPSGGADKGRNAGTAVVRSGTGRVFAVRKRRHGLGRIRFPGLAGNMTFHGLAAVAPDIREGAMFPRLHGLPRSAAGGQARGRRVRTATNRTKSGRPAVKPTPERANNPARPQPNPGNPSPMRRSRYGIRIAGWGSVGVCGGF